MNSKRKLSDESGSSYTKRKKDYSHEKELTGKSQSNFTPREFQVELLQKALKRNIIVCSGTGTGKTFISVMLIKELQHEVMKPYLNGGKRTIFITEKIPLVTQQADVLDSHLCLNVGRYSSDMGVDSWDKQQWEKEFVAKEVLVMTNQILVNILSTSFLNPKQINLLIIDECHYAVNKHPVVQVMKRLKDFNALPKILGLTASVLNGKCKILQVENRVRQLETNLNSVIETPSARASAATFATDPEERALTFKSSVAYGTLLQEIVNELNIVSQKVSVEKKKEYIRIDNEDWLKEMYDSSVKLSKVVQDLVYVVEEMGIWCAWQIIDVLTPILQKVEDNQLEESIDNLKIVQDILRKIKTKCDAAFELHAKKTTKSDVSFYFTSEKVKMLLQALLEVRNDKKQETQCQTQKSENEHKGEMMKGIVFVERRVAAWILSKHLNQLAETDADYGFLKTQPIMGHGSSLSQYTYARSRNKEQQQRIMEFRTGMCNLLIATQVVEEGMDIPECNLIIRFDEPKDFRSYIQSKGRARSADSLYIFLLPVDKEVKVMEEIKLYHEIEKKIYEICHDRLTPTEEETSGQFDSWQLPSYYSGNRRGPCVSSVDAIQRVNWYCQLLPKDQLTILVPTVLYMIKTFYIKPEHLRKLDDLKPFQNAKVVDEEFYYEHEIPATRTIPPDHSQCFRCAILLPLNSSIKELIVGDFLPSKKLAKQSVALKVVEKLHKAGELSDELLPVRINPTEFLKQFIDIEEKQVKENSFKPGSKKRRGKYVKKVATILKDSGPLSGFYLYKIHIVSHSTEQEEGFSSSQILSENKCLGIVTSKKLSKDVEPFPLYSKNANMWITIHLVKCTQKTLTNTELHTLKNFQILLFEKLLKISSAMFTPLEHGSGYLISPIQTATSGFTLDWSMMEKLNSFNFSEVLPAENERRLFRYQEANYRDVVVMLLHDKLEKIRLYIVKNVEHSTTPRTQMPNESENFVEYYRSKYNIEIQCLNQPLLNSTQVQKCVNLLPLKQERKQKLMTFNGKQRKHAEFLVPELVTILPISSFLLEQAVMLPCILYRFNSLCIAEELSQAIQMYDDIQEKLPHAQWSDVEKTCQVKAIRLYQKDKNCIKTEISWNLQNVMENEEMENDELYANDDPPPSIMLKALTLLGANDVMNLERLETLGDSFLKYATSIYLFCERNELDEGWLTMARSKIISNNHLYHLGKQRNIGEFIQQDKFSPYFNWLPPNVGIDKSKEDILVSARVPFNLWKHVAGIDLRSLNTEEEIWREIKNKAEGADVKEQEILNSTEEVINNFTCQMINDKSIADTVEALIGAHLLHVGPSAALRFLRWMKVKIFPMSTDEEEITGLNIPVTAWLNESQEIPSERLSGLDRFQEKIGYTFRNVSFLLQAFTHASYLRKPITDCYQRLEFLGDAILDYLVTWQIFKDDHNFNPGQISDLRSALVNNETFARLAVENEFDVYLKESNPTLFSSIKKFKQMLDDEKLFYRKLKYLVLEGETLKEEEIQVPKALGDIFESVAGAIYLDSGLSLDSLWKVYGKMLQPLIDKYSEDIPINPLRKLYELFPNPTFRKLKTSDISGNDIYQVIVQVSEGYMFTGYGKNFQLAKQSAVKNALRIIEHADHHLDSAI